MKIIDANTVNYILKMRLNLQQDYYITEDIREEADIVELITGVVLSPKVALVSQSPFFNEAKYIANYKDALNKFQGRSFYNMSGFGDISILAFLKTVESAMQSQAKERLFDFTEDVEIFTEDQALIKKIKKISGKVKIKDNRGIK